MDYLHEYEDSAPDILSNSFRNINDQILPAKILIADAQDVEIEKNLNCDDYITVNHQSKLIFFYKYYRIVHYNEREELFALINFSISF